MKLKSLILKTGVKGNLPSARILSTAPWLSILLVRRDVQKYKSTLICGPWLILGWTLRDLEGTWLKNWCQRDPEGKQVDRAFQMVKACEDICFYVNAIEGWIQQRSTLIIRWRRWAILWTSPPASPATLSLLSWLMNKVTMGAEMKIIPGLIVVCLPGTTWLWLLREPNMLIAEVKQ